MHILIMSKNNRVDAHLWEDCITSENVYSGKFLKAYRDRVRLPDGTESEREYLKHVGAVMIIACLDNGKLVFERQFRYPVGRVFIEMPSVHDKKITARIFP